jgi:DNA-binding winged helix-turn-helix (wHTH) protein
LEHPGEVVSRKAFCDQLWPGNDRIDVATNLNSTINKLRRLLCDTSGDHPLIETIVHKGYVFSAKVEYADCAISEDPERQPVREGKSRPHWPPIARVSHAELQTVYFKASLIALTIASMLFGAAVALYAFRPISHP